MKISTLILLSFFAIMVLLSVSTFMHIRQDDVVESSSVKLQQSANHLRQSSRYQRNFLTMVSGLRGYLLTGEPSFIQTYDSALSENNEIMQELSAELAGPSEQRIILDDIDELERYWIEEFATPLLTAKANARSSGDGNIGFQKAYQRKLVDGLENDVHESIRNKFAELTTKEYKRRGSDLGNLSQLLSNTRLISTLIAAVSIAIGLLISAWLAWYISSRINKMIHMSRAIANGQYQMLPAMNTDPKDELGLLSAAMIKMAEIVRKNMRTLQNQREALDEFSDVVAHDLKVPLRGIGNAIASMKTHEVASLPQDLRGTLFYIKDNVVRIENLLNSLQAYSKSGKSDHYKEVVEVDEILEIIRGYGSLNSRIRFNIRKGFPVLYTERLLLEQIFTNLIMNTVSLGDHEMEIGVYCKMEGEFYHFYIEHNFLTSDSARERAFTNFETLSSDVSPREFEIGLSIVKRIIEERDLDLRMSMVPGRRSVFCFTWPKNEINEANNKYSIGRK